jgi:hypothetical protein
VVSQSAYDNDDNDDNDGNTRRLASMVVAKRFSPRLDFSCFDPAKLNRSIKYDLYRCERARYMPVLL